jgi:hypothetical protein
LRLFDLFFHDYSLATTGLNKRAREVVQQLHPFTVVIVISPITFKVFLFARCSFSHPTLHGPQKHGQQLNRQQNTVGECELGHPPRRSRTVPQHQTTRPLRCVRPISI